MSTSTDVCQNQDMFNNAVEKAIKNIDNQCQSSSDCRWRMQVIGIIMLIFYIYAIILAMKIQDPDQRLLHIVLAMLTGPLYIIAYYLRKFSSLEEI
jgi:hypothetical protein